VVELDEERQGESQRIPHQKPNEVDHSDHLHHHHPHTSPKRSLMANRGRFLAVPTSHVWTLLERDRRQRNKERGEEIP
jgi:hypothetical protein